MRKNICRKQRRNSSEIEHRIAIAFLISIFIFFGKYNTVVILNVIGYQGQAEPWAIKESVRSRGSVKKDFIVSSGADLSRRNLLAVYPKPGWYKTRKKLGKANSVIRYSLIMSIETENNNVDIYNPVFNIISNYVRV